MHFLTLTLVILGINVANGMLGDYVKTQELLASLNDLFAIDPTLKSTLEALGLVFTGTGYPTVYELSHRKECHQQGIANGKTQDLSHAFFIPLESIEFDLSLEKIKSCKILYDKIRAVELTNKSKGKLEIQKAAAEFEKAESNGNPAWVLQKNVGFEHWHVGTAWFDTVAAAIQGHPAIKRHANQFGQVNFRLSRFAPRNLCKFQGLGIIEVISIESEMTPTESENATSRSKVHRRLGVPLAQIDAEFAKGKPRAQQKLVEGANITENGEIQPTEPVTIPVTAATNTFYFEILIDYFHWEIRDMNVVDTLDILEENMGEFEIEEVVAVKRGFNFEKTEIWEHKTTSRAAKALEEAKKVREDAKAKLAEKSENGGKGEEKRTRARSSANAQPPENITSPLLGTVGNAAR